MFRDCCSIIYFLSGVFYHVQYYSSRRPLMLKKIFAYQYPSSSELADTPQSMQASFQHGNKFSQMRGRVPLSCFVQLRKLFQRRLIFILNNTNPILECWLQKPRKNYLSKQVPLVPTRVMLIMMGRKKKKKRTHTRTRGFIEEKNGYLDRFLSWFWFWKHLDK